MGELSKVVRWSAPGSVFILMTFAFVSLGKATFAQRIWPAPEESALLPWPEASGGAVVLLAAASVPLGFVIYQIYYYGFSRPEPFGLSYVHRDVALDVQARLGWKIEGLREGDWRVRKVRGLFLRRPSRARVPFTEGTLSSLWLYKPASQQGTALSAPGGSNPETDVAAAQPDDQALTAEWLRRAHGISKAEALEERKKLLRDHARTREYNWIRLEMELDSRLRGLGDSERNMQDMERLADVFHTLGAAKTAVGNAFVLAVLWVVCRVLGRVDDIDLQTLVLLATFTAVSFAGGTALYLLLHENRRHCLHRRIVLMTTMLERTSSPGTGQTH